MTGVKVQKGVKVCSRQYAVGSKNLTCLLLLTAFCLLLTVFPGCGKKAPPKPPQEAAWIK